MTKKLFYQDQYLKKFSASISKQQQDNEEKWYVVLDQTAFYPTGGGQPSDTGFINGINVGSVEEIEGEVRHYLDQAITGNGPVHGQIDWPRRFDHMQQHAGQHILSAAFEELFGFKTISFHLGKEICTIDLDITELTQQQMNEAEELANDVILVNHPIETRWVSMEELEQYQLRKELSVEDNIRLVIIPNFDYNGCGGTHPNATAEVVAIKIIDYERVRGRIRLEFICGNRVRKQLALKQGVIKELNQLLNAPEDKFAQLIGKLIDDGKSVEKSLQETRDKLIEYEAKDIINRREIVNGLNVVGEIFNNRSIKELQKTAQLIVSEAADLVVILISSSQKKVQLVVARGNAIDINMKELLEKSLPFINGKGGGNEKIAQGGGTPLLTSENLLEKVKESME
ncbi:alanyl-tRNA editing protein [Aquibacillus saliphilus]|uniref:alanyl-tRNA editing protein n=1 Tax=Aquibacillus saliphilus TaxID=1909422 RepID=UPI001CF09C54|nr:DHHA1 domain-containing protein [Aquibacillus saliphilus]